MSNKHFRLNKTTKTLGSLFPALLLFTPAVAFASTIDQSTSIPQNFSTDAEYVGNDSNLLIVFYVQIMPDDFVMQLHRF